MSATFNSSRPHPPITAAPSIPAVRLRAAGRILLAALAAFVVSGAWYTLFCTELAELHSSSAAGDKSLPAWLFLAELARSLVVASALAILAAKLNIVGWRSAAGLGCCLWIAFPATLLAGSVLWENVPWKMAAIHAGDWLLKLPVMAVICNLGHIRGDPIQAALVTGQ